MNRRTALFFLCTSALTGSLVVGSSVEGCRGNTNLGAGGGSGIGGASSSASGAPGTGGVMGAGGNSNVPVVTIPQITDPTAPGFVNSTQVQLKGLVATSIKFEVSKSSSGECLWGVFLSTPGLATATPHSAILAVNDGTQATAMDGGGKAYCPTIQANQPAGDLFPDDTLPGDVFDVVGLAGSYGPSSCGAPDASAPNNSDVGQYQLSKLSTVTRISRGAPVPAPYVLSASDAMTLSAGQDSTFLGAWGGAQVTVQNVTALQQQGSLFDSYGHMLLNNGLQVGDKLYYVGYVEATDICYAGPYFSSTMPTFTSITGFAYLDFCTWGIDPSDKCHAFVPPSDDCESVVDAGPDASPAKVCLHTPIGSTP
jgi:hypothetical protein